MTHPIEKHWLINGPVAFALWPLSWLYCGLASWRRRYLEKRREPLVHPTLPGKKVLVLVVGNISVGGTGKTPMVIWLQALLRAHRYTPGIVSRGYGGGKIGVAQRVTSSSDTHDVGDEAVVMARRTNSPVWVCADRRGAIDALLAHAPDTDIIISDDGLQHYRMPRDLEIVMVDGVRRFGNQLCLPAGPLREPVKRLREVDFRVVTGILAEEGEYTMDVEGTEVVNLAHAARVLPIENLAGEEVHAVAGLGNPERFFRQLEHYGIVVQRHVYPDHHAYSARDLDFGDSKKVIMTEKDAVKCTVFANASHWYLPVKARPDAAFAPALIGRLKEIQRG
ncbi:MAG: tetraacyldisaccharide 4'-kinase [bacterium]